jgi:hypothetical protein
MITTITMTTIASTVTRGERVGLGGADTGAGTRAE